MDNAHSDPQTRTIAMPADTNMAGDIFGGWVLSQMDLAGASYATLLVGKRVVTAGINGMSFHHPIFVGDRVSCYCESVHVGRTSITILVKTWVYRKLWGSKDESQLVTEGRFTFVAVNENGEKELIPKDCLARSLDRNP